MKWLYNPQTGNSKWWSWWLAIGLMLFCYLVVGGIPLIYGVRAGLFGIDLDTGMISGVSEPIAFGVQMISPIMLFLGVWLAQRLVHRRSLLSLVTTKRFRWQLLWQATFVWLLVLIISAIFESLVYRGRYVWSLDVGRWLVMTPLVLLLIPIQSSGEELFFRAYLLQSCGRLTRRRFLLSIISGFAFMLPHLVNPEMHHALGGTFVMAANYFLFGAAIAWLSLRDGGIERAIGVHVINNIYAASFVGYAHSVLSTPTLMNATILDAWWGIGTLIIGFGVLFYLPSPANGVFRYLYWPNSDC